MRNFLIWLSDSISNNYLSFLITIIFELKVELSYQFGAKIHVKRGVEYPWDRNALLVKLMFVLQKQKLSILALEYSLQLKYNKFVIFVLISNQI
jgi:hypothetical protein